MGFVFLTSDGVNIYLHPALYCRVIAEQGDESRTIWRYVHICDFCQALGPEDEEGKTALDRVACARLWENAFTLEDLR
jgi:hypothetical protein